MTGNAFNMNKGDGSFFLASGTGDISSNTANGNERHGLFAAGRNFRGNITGNTANDNGTPFEGGDGINVGVLDFSGNITDNVAGGNQGCGISITSANPSQETSFEIQPVRISRPVCC